MVNNAIGLPMAITDPLNRLVVYSYDNLGNLVELTNPAGESTSAAFDALGRVVAITNPLGHVTSFIYDAAGRLTCVIDANGGTIGYRYDSYGRLIEKISPDGEKQTYAYRTDNLLNSKTDCKGQTTTYSYDSAKRLTQENAAGEVTTYAYSARDQLISTTNLTGTVSAIYDDVGRLTQESNNGKTIQYSYNSEGERLSFAALGATTNYAYDNRGLLSSITSPSGVFTFAYDLMGRTISLTHPNNDVIRYQYNVASQLTGITSTGIVNVNYGYEHDAAGRITRWTGDGSDWFYQYDAAGRLVRADHGQDGFAYAYDPLGNILDNGRTHDIANRLLADNNYTFAYDQNGSLTRKQHKSTGAWTEYTWNARNQLARVDRYPDAVAVTPTKTLEYAYDAFGRRLSKIDGNKQYHYLYDGYNPISILDDLGGIAKTFTFGAGFDQILGSSTASENQYYYRNHQSSVMFVSNSAEAISNYYYSPFGITTQNEGFSNQYRFTGREQEEEDLYYYRLRYYDPLMRRFISRDPLGILGGLNLYAYTNNDPVNRVDPLGLYAGVDDAIFAGGGALVGILGQGVGDLISGQLSGWEDYVGAAIGGAAGGEALLYTGPVGAGAIGGSVTNLTKQGLKNLTGKQCGFDGLSLATDTGIGALTGFIPGIKIQGVTAGRGSYNAIFRQIGTKFQNGTISNISSQTAGKMFVGRAVNTSLIPGVGAAAVATYGVEKLSNNGGDVDCGCRK